MGGRTRIAAFVLALSHGVIGCSGSQATPTAPTATAAAPQPTVPPTGWSYGGGFALTRASLSGIVGQMTGAGMAPVAGVRVYCDACGEFGHTSTTTDASGSYRFEGDLNRGGGIWLSGSGQTALIVSKGGYAVSDPVRVFPDGAGMKTVVINGDTRFDVLLVKH